ncbi:hypothetical protein [Chelativorans alearense]|uniref:hypothetical protein n=1 Tax=Chelativorans alearense TaxID=2681495 RepID=UPI0013D5F153|nr:hypothetical protein [Chelativorans alearense]
MPVLENTALALLLVGTTHVLSVGGKEAVIYYEDEDTAHMLLPDGTAYTGSWRMEAKSYAVDWHDGPSARWMLDRYAPGRIAYVEADGERRAELKRIVFGNSESLPK